MRILLTGGTGFIGRQVAAALLRAGHEVIVPSRTARRASTGVKHVELDLFDRSAVRALVESLRPEGVVHLAWCVEHGIFWTAPENLRWVAATMHLAVVAQEAGCQRFVGIGTCFEYDWPRDAVCCETTTPICNHTLYDTAKDATRRVLQAYSDLGDMEFAWARLFFSYGEAEPPRRLVASVARALIRGEPARCGAGESVRDFMDVRDMGRAIAMVAESRIVGPVNIGNGEGISIRDVVLMLGELVGRPDLVRLGELPDPPSDPPMIVAHMSRLRDEAGYVPRYGLREGLLAALAYWQRGS